MLKVGVGGSCTRGSQEKRMGWCHFYWDNHWNEIRSYNNSLVLCWEPCVRFSVNLCCDVS
jgi:hypothetical protein